jgi:hypothetical protein
MITPEQIQMILSQGQENPELQRLHRQMQMVQGLRERAMQGTPNPTAGGRVLPNWSNVLANVGGAYMGSKAEPTINAGIGQINQQGVDARKQYLQILMNALRQQQSPQPAPPVPMAPQPGEPGPGMGLENY